MSGICSSHILHSHAALYAYVADVCCSTVVQVADGGPGMTLGRWLDMRGIQINSYPGKARSTVARSRRPLDIGKGLVSAAATACWEGCEA
jgi:hypothetical protein